MPSDDCESPSDPRTVLSQLGRTDLLPLLFEHAPMGVAVLRRSSARADASADWRGADWRFVIASPTFPSPSGEPVAGRTVREVYASTEETAIAALEQVRRTGEPLVQREVEMHLEPGRQATWWNITDYPLLNQNGQVDEVLVLALEVTNEVLARGHVQEQGRAIQHQTTEAQTERQRLQALLETLPVGIAIMNARGRVIQANSAYLKVWGQGRAPGSLIEDHGAYKGWWADTGEPLAPEEWASAQALRSGNPVLGQMIEIQRFDGSRAHVLNSAAPLRDAKGNITGSAVAIQNVTALHESQQALRESEEQLELLFEESPVLVALLDLATGKYVRVNRAFEEITGYARQEAIRHTPLELGLVSVEDHQYYLDVVRAGRGITNHELAVRARDGHLVESLISVRPVEAGGRRYALIVARDITDRKQAEETLRSTAHSLRESQESLREVLENSRVAIYRRNLLTGVYEYVSPSIVTVHGFTAAEVMAMKVSESRARIHPEDRPVFDAHERALRDSTEPSPTDAYEFRFLAKDGQYTWLSSTRRVVRDAEGRSAVLIGNMRNINDQVLAEEALRWSEEELRKSAGALRELNETLEQHVAERTALAEQRAEELRALAAELARAEEQERRRLAGLLHDHMQQILVGAILQLDAAQRRLPSIEARLPINQALELIEEALEASRSLTAELSPSILHDAGLGPALHWLGDWVRTRHHLEVAVATDDGAEAPAIPEDTGALLFHSARELLFNVVKHAGVQEAAVELYYPTPDSVRVVVSDEGRGLDATEERDGAKAGGFGLFSIRERLAYVGGQFELQSAPGQGTRVSMTLPLRSAAREAVEPQSQGAMEATAGRRKLRLFLADDHPIVRKGLAQLLSNEPDMEVVGEAGDGEEALEQVGQLQPDIVLMDVNMPRLDGIEATRRLAESYPKIRVIGLSMFSDRDREAVMCAAGAVAYVAKGGPPDALLATIRACQDSDARHHAIGDSG